MHLKNKSALCLLFALMLCSLSVVAGTADIQGLALVSINSKRVNLELDQAVLITDKTATFIGFDDFGGEVFRISFSDKGMYIAVKGELLYAKTNQFQKILSIPLTQEEFLQIMQFRIDDNAFVERIKEDGVIVWKKKTHKKVSVIFRDFMKTKSKRLYPKKTTISYKKNSFDLTWVKFKKVR
ncbi:hypothetical protein KJ708_03970 [bacterium]|nr:hypothetical protein [bacterium]MBU1917071.1 hypothetical protein [bacterium]